MKNNKAKLKQQQEDLFDFWLKAQAQSNPDPKTLGKECYQKGFTDALLYMLNSHVYGIKEK